MKARYIFLVMVAGMLVSCTKSVKVTVTQEVINPCYLGNGIEWDPYDEAIPWGAALSDEDWNTLYERLDYMQPQYVRCMINSPFTYYTGKGFEDGRNSENIKKLLEYCQSRGVMVVYGEYNPPAWEMKGSKEWVEASVRFAFWKEMVGRFQAEMDKYPALKGQVDIAGPDAVIDYANPASEYDAEGWLKATVENVPEVGIYDMHAYPGQRYVRSGEFEETLKRLKALVDKPVILGEVGFKYFSDPADSTLAQEYWKRVEGHPFTKGSDCNMMVYDDFYALDMPLLLMSVMNSGFSAAAAWMLDDAMHSNGDSGRIEDVKLWGMWNILGAEVFGDPSQEEVRPWYYTWSLMCRHFPAGSKILEQEGDLPENVASTAAQLPDGSYSVAFVNYGSESHPIDLKLPVSFEGYSLQTYHSGLEKKPVSNGRFVLPAQTFAIVSK